MLEFSAEKLRVNVCTIMSMMSEQMLPSACEVDIAGVVGMYALQLASGRPAHWSTGTIIMVAMRTSASSFTAETGPRISCRISVLRRRQSWARRLARRTPSVPWKVAQTLAP